jgi:hypothetical protein
MRGTHIVKHVLRLKPGNDSLIAFSAIFDPDADQVTVTGAHGSLAIRLDRIEEVEYLLKAAKDLRDEGGWATEF